MEQLDADPAETLMVGDTDYDLKMARAAGAGCVAVAWGAHDARRLAGHGALACLDSLLCLPGWLDDFESDLTQHG
jgi:phosphoglycolate phosphatase